MFSPLRTRRTAQVANVKSVPAPVKGWNARDGLAMMKPGYAVVLDNYFSGTSSCDLRGGSDRHVKLDSVTTAPETLMVFSSGTTNKMLACADGNIYDVTTAGTVSSTLSTSHSNDRFSYDHMGGYIVAVNGADTPIKYDGSSVTTTTITGSGLTAANLSYVCQSQSRLFFIEKDTLNAWYLGTNAVAGTASKLDFTGYCSLGGKLVAVGRWTRDGGSGIDDLTCFFTNKGEVLVYAGSDPSSADTWALVGVFRIAAPIGDRPLMKSGADLIVITEDGYAPLSRVLPIDRVGSERLSISDAIRDAVATAVKTHRAKFGWQAILYPNGPYALFNVPTSEGLAAEQHVLNTITGAWCRFKGLKAVCWALFNDKIYFGAPGGYIVEADTDDYKDDTLEAVQAYSVIQGDIVPAYDYFGSTAQQKQFTMARPVIYTNGNPTISVVMNTDFSRGTPEQVDTAQQTGTPWGSPWGSPWGGVLKIIKNWLSVSGVGYNGSLHIRTRTAGIQIAVNSIDYTYIRGGVL